MITEKVVKRTQIGVGNVIKLKKISSNIIVARNKRNDGIPALRKVVVRLILWIHLKNCKHRD